ncbi:MAG: sugar O-acetyltransferase precursor [Flavipsychrobacter sp.]|jgi:hypothetical protein|nr:sugar O-acetyltransferase precursor [Flavipsychrobacter sp.]
MADKVKKWILAFALVILFLPMLQHAVPFIESGTLKGSFKDADDVTYSVEKWMDGSYQRQKELYLNDHAGFRPDLVRLYNQLDFSLFRKCHAGWDIRGKKDMLFQWPYIEAYYGNDFIGYDAAMQKAVMLKAIQDTLSRLGKSLVLVYAPSKATFYPEYFPNDRVQEKHNMSNYEAYRRLGDSLGINQVDMDAWFLSMKNKSKELLFSKQGIHWTSYGAILAGDSVMRYIEKLRNIRIAHPVWEGVERTSAARYGDDEIAVECNLIFPAAREVFAYPVTREVNDSTAAKPNLICLSDSYGHKMVLWGVVSKMTGKCELWMYFNQAIDVKQDKYYDMNSYDWKDALAHTDCLVLLYTTFNLKELGSGFIEAAYAHYYPAGK